MFARRVVYDCLAPVALLFFCSSLAQAQQEEQESPDSYVTSEYKPKFYTGFAFAGYQGLDISQEFSTISYRTTGTGLTLNYASRFFGLNLNVFRAFAFGQVLVDPDATVLVNWAEAGVSIPVIRHWGGGGFFSKYALLLTANTSLFRRVYRQHREDRVAGEPRFLEDRFPQIYDVGLEFRRNLFIFKIGHLWQLRKYHARRPEFSRVPADMTGPYFEIAVGLGFWSKKQETHIRRKKKKIILEEPPEIHAKIAFSEPSGNQKLDGGEIGTIRVNLKNAGKGIAKGTVIRLRALNHGPEGITFSKNVPIEKDIEPNTSMNLDIPVAASREVRNDQVEIEVEVFGKNFPRIIETVSFAVQEYDATDEPRVTKMDNPDAVAVVIGIRNYKDPQIPPVRYAVNDARVVREYLIKTLGVKPENILPRDANELLTAGGFKTLIRHVLPSYVKKGISDVYFYYAGHGAPNTKSKQPFLVPYDCNPNYVNSDNAYAIDDLYTDLAKVEAKHLTVIIDACFSGYNGDGQAVLQNISPVKLIVKNDLIMRPAVTYLASSKTDQISNWYPEKKHGLFTYFLLRGLRGEADANGDRRITVGELGAYLKNENAGVPYWSNRLFLRPQNPLVFSFDTDRVIVDYSK